VRRRACLLIAIILVGCGGGGGGGGGSTPPPAVYSVTLGWAPNHESGVNSTGGGYQVLISGQPTINVPYTSGPTAPTSTTVSLQGGSYTATVRAYAALDAQGGSGGSLSVPSAPITVNVP
jgi:hypothetical protein